MKPHKTLWEDQIQNAVWCGLNAVWWTFLSSNPLSALRCHLFLHRSFLGMALVLVWGLLWRGFGAILSPVIHTEVTILTIPYFFFTLFKPSWMKNEYIDGPSMYSFSPNVTFLLVEDFFHPYEAGTEEYFPIFEIHKILYSNTTLWHLSMVIIMIMIRIRMIMMTRSYIQTPQVCLSNCQIVLSTDCTKWVSIAISGLPRPTFHYKPLIDSQAQFTTKYLKHSANRYLQEIWQIPKAFFQGK